jgi:hypothetical protein
MRTRTRPVTNGSWRPDTGSTTDQDPRGRGLTDRGFWVEAVQQFEAEAQISFRALKSEDGENVADRCVPDVRLDRRPYGASGEGHVDCKLSGVISLGDVRDGRMDGYAVLGQIVGIEARPQLPRTVQRVRAANLSDNRVANFRSSGTSNPRT